MTDATSIFENVPSSLASYAGVDDDTNVAALWAWYRGLSDAEPIRNQTDTTYRRTLALALADEQGACALCREPFRVSALTNQPLATLENVTGTLAEDAPIRCDRLPYLHGGVVALHGDCNSNHGARRAWMAAHGVSHIRLTDTATRLANVRV